jgi:hypothetical protein
VLATSFIKAIHLKEQKEIMMIERMLEPFSSDNTQLMLAVRESEVGEQLQKQIRYERYCVIPEGIAHYDLPEDRQAEVTKQWCEDLLDPDVNNMQHHPVTALIGQWACEFDEVDAETKDRVVRALLVHDVKEVRFSASDEGDLTYDESHAQGMEGFQQEHNALARMLVEYGFLDEAAANEVEADMNDGKKSQPETEHGQYVEIAERIGYLHAAGRAVEAAINIIVESEPNLEQYDRLLWMAENCYANSLARLIELSASHPSVAEFLRLRQSQIKYNLELIATTQSEILELYASDGKDAEHVAQRKQKFDHAFAAHVELVT